MTKYKSFLFTFLLFASLATVFPPFEWLPAQGEPQCKYCFLLDDSTKNVPLDSDYPYDETIKKNRHLVISELFMEYLGAFLVGLLVQVVVNAVSLKRRARRERYS